MNDHLLALLANGRRLGITQSLLLAVTLAALVAVLYTLGAPSYVGG